MNIVGNVFGLKDVDGKHINQEMVSYIGGKKVKKSEKRT